LSDSSSSSSRKSCCWRKIKLYPASKHVGIFFGIPAIELLFDCLTITYTNTSALTQDDNVPFSERSKNGHQTIFLQPRCAKSRSQFYTDAFVGSHEVQSTTPTRKSIGKRPSRRSVVFDVNAIEIRTCD
jgi:hypothetical protein